MKVWHDDIRKPPDETWTWARTNAAAIELLERGGVSEISLDHDLGLDHLDPDAHPESIYFAGRSPNGDGRDLVRWMVVNRRVPARVTIHSWNPGGAKTMAGMLNEWGFDCIVAPFQPTVP